MGFLLCALATCLIALSVAQSDNCPPPETVAPCKCDGEGVSCTGAISFEQIKKSFRAKYKEKYVRSIWIQGTQMDQLHGDTFDNFKLENLYVELGILTTIHNFDVLRHSKPLVKIISVYGNKLNSISYGYLRDYKNLRKLNAGKNVIENIDNDAFNQPKLTTLILSENKIKRVGERAFRDLVSLQFLDLRQNLITTLGRHALFCRSVVPDLWVNLGENHIDTVDKDAFEEITPLYLHLYKNQMKNLNPTSFLPVISRMAQKNGTVGVWENSFGCNECNDYRWIVENKETALKMLYGFKCTDGTTIDKLTLSKIRC